MTNDRVASASEGKRFGVYLLHECIGAGGMGEVYRARDTRLGRDVAVKILTREFTAEPDRLARFEREARALAAINHPNIATIHGVEDSGGIRALVMELVEGSTLAERLSRGPIPVAEAMAIARQIADALEAAHEKGIIHRDLKPANIKVTPSGLVKVLDFGLAKAVVNDDAAEGAGQLPTVTVNATREGLIVGTAAYMSPEQARGQSVDKRTDIWAFGCVLYEMLTGRAAFARSTLSDTIAAVLDREPDWQLLPPSGPATVWRLIRHCLAKDPRLRLRDAGDARIEIDELTLSGEMPPAAASPRPWVWAIGGFVTASLLVGGIAVFMRSGRIPERPAQFTLSFAGQMTGVVSTAVPIPSPDGRHFVFVGTSDNGETSLFIRPLDSAEASPLPGTIGSETPVWSPDGKWIGFFAEGKLKKVAASGGPPQTIASLPGFQDPAWGPHGDIIFRPGNRQPLFRISESGGTPAPLTQLNSTLAENSHRGPNFLPDGRRFLFTSRCAAPENNALYIGSLDSTEVRRVMSAASKAIFVPSRNGSPAALIYYRDGALEARPFDPDNETFTGNPQPVISGVDYSPSSIQAFFQVSADGRVIVVRPAGSGDTQFSWFDRSGEQTGTLGAAGNMLQPRISPQGDRVVFTRPDAQTGNRDLWTMDVARGLAARLTLHPANDWRAVWSPDGKRIAFGSDRDGGTETMLYLKRSMDPGGEESSLLGIGGGPTDWSRDGQWIAYGDTTIGIVAASGAGKPFPFLAAPFRYGGARFAPDGKWLAYVSDETGKYEVFVRPFAGGPAASEGKIQISDNGGDFPIWRSDGRELYYLSRDLTIYAVATSDLKSGTVSRPERLFRACPRGNDPVSLPLPTRGASSWGYMFDTIDGKRFLVNCAAHPLGQFVVLMNWSPAAKR